MNPIQAISPIDGSLIAEFGATSAEAIQQQMQAARKAAGEWANVPIKQRSKILNEIVPLLLSELDNICDLVVRTTGKVRTDALLGEIYPVLDLCRYYQKHAAAILAPQSVTTSPLAFPASTARIERKPYGVVAIISPWNYPFQLSLVPILTALFAGNAVILKPSELCLPIGRLIVDLCAKLNLPPDLLQWAIGAGETGQHLIDAGPDLLFFTGSVNAGRAVMKQAAERPIPVIMELGGKDPMIVLADADLSRAANAALYGAFCNSGQVCVSVERLYVQQDCHDEFLQLLLDRAGKLHVGHGEFGDLGAMINSRQIDVVKAHYDDAIAQGAAASGPWVCDGSYVKPIVLWNVNQNMRIMREETFGPLLPVMTFDDENQAVKLGNDSEFGLNASIWSRDIARAERMAKRLQTGNWAVNDVLKNIGHAGLPFGGVKKSGFGRYHGAEGLLNFTYPVSGVTNRSRLIKEPNWFPYSEQRYRDLKGYLDFVYGSGSLLQRMRRNSSALQAFREYSAIDWKQTWHNLRSMFPWKWRE